MSNERALTGENVESRALVPNLRFPEFRDAGPWKLGVLGDLISESKEKNRGLVYGPEHVLSVSGEHGCVNQIDFLGRSYAGASVKQYNVVRTGDIVYTKSPLKACPNGVIKTNKGPTGIVSILYAVYGPKPTADPRFIDYYFSSDIKLNNYLQPIVKKGPKNSILVNNADVLKGAFAAPGLTEQQKIADCLASLDAVIAAEVERLTALKAHKKGLMQKVFPAEGQTTPRLRFPQFQSSGNWTETTLQFALAQPATYGIVKAGDYQVSGVPMVRGGDIKEGVINTELPLVSEAIHRQYRRTITRKGDVLIALVGYPGECAVVPEALAGANISRAVGLLRPTSKLDPRFLASYLNSDRGRRDVLAPSAGSAQLVVNLAALNGLNITLPEAAEQRQIADLLAAADAALKAQSEKIDALWLHKFGLMQKLFPAPNEVSA